MCESDPTLSTRVLEDAGGGTLVKSRCGFGGLKGGGGQVVLLPACTQPTHSARFLNAYAKKRKMVQMVLNALSPFFHSLWVKKGTLIQPIHAYIKVNFCECGQLAHVTVMHILVTKAGTGS